ncbi:MAG: PAS domain S-box protein [Planctomycetota bacterium]
MYLEVATRASEIGDRSLLMKAYLKLGQVYAHHGEFEQAVKWLSRARTLAITSGHSLMEAQSEDALGSVRFMTFRYHEALQHHERALSLHLQMERAMGEAEALRNIAACEAALGRYEHAIEHCQRVIAMPDVPGTRPQRAWALVHHAKLQRMLGALDRAERDLELAFALCESAPHGAVLTAAHAERGWVYLERGSTAWARAEFTRALELEQDADAVAATLEARAGLAELGLRLGERELARKNIELLLQQGEGAGRTRFLARAHLLLAELRTEKADPHLVETHVTDAVLLAETIAEKELLREVSYRAARLRERLGHTEEALDLFRRAADLTEQLCMSLGDPSYASSFRRSNQRDRAAKAVKRLSERLSGLGSAASPLVAPTADVLLKHVLALAQCRTPEALLDRTMEAILEIANMPLGFARVHGDDQQDLLRCIGSAEDETLHSRRLEGSFAVAERTMRTGEVLLCPDSNSSPEFGELMGTSTHPLRSFLCLPLPSSQHPGSNLGVLFAADFSPRTFDQFPTTQQLLKLARAAAGHLEPLLEVQGLRRKGSTLAGENKALVTLKRTAEILAGTGELPDRLGDALVEILEATGARQVGVVRIEGGREEILAVRTRRGARIPLGHPVSRGMLDLLLATGSRVFVEDASTSPPFRNFESVDNLKIRSAVLCPARIDGQIAAAVFADQGDLATRSLSRDAASLLEAFSDQVGALLQNARLGRELSRSKRELEAIFEDAPFPIAALDSHFTIRAFNRAAEFETGFARGELVGVRKAHHLLSPREGGEGPMQLLRELNHTGACEGEVWMVRADGSDFLAHLDLRSMTSADGAPLGYAGIFRNITQERDAEATVQRFRHILQVLSEGVLVADAEGRITFANEAAENILEYDRGELKDKHVSVLIPPSTKPSMTDILRSAKSGAWRGEVAMLIKHGTLAPIHLSVSWVRGLDGQPRATVAIISDIRDRKRHEDELRRLSGRVITAQEEERRRLALELHDESAQALTALLLNLEFLGRITTDEEPKTQITRCAQIVRDTMAEFKRIAADLHPAVLDKFGLIPALKKHCTDFAQDTGLQVSFHVKGGIEVAPGPSSTALFRIAQQALTNVARHAQAKQIAVRLRRRGNDLTLTVADDGQGFELKSLEARSQEGIGLISMRERVAAFGGSFKIRTVPGKGTSVRARVPLLDAAVASPAVVAKQDDQPEEVLK